MLVTDQNDVKCKPMIQSTVIGHKVGTSILTWLLVQNLCKRKSHRESKIKTKEKNEFEENLFLDCK